MKNKVIIAAALMLALIVSFAFTSSSSKVTKTSASQTRSEPLGGFVAESKF